MILPGSLLIGYGMNAALTGQAQIFVDAAPADAYGAVTSSRLTIGQLGYSLGMIVTTLLLSRLTASGIVHGLTAEGLSSQDAYTTLAALNASLLSGRPPAVDDLSGVLRVAASAFDTAFDVRMVIGAAVMVATAAAAWLLMRERGRGHREPQPKSGERRFGPLLTTGGRLRFLDLARGLAIVFMVFQHVQILFAVGSGEDSSVGVAFLLLGTAPAAPVFMVAMGFLFGSSSRTGCAAASCAACSSPRTTPLRVRARRAAEEEAHRDHEHRRGRGGAEEQEGRRRRRSPPPSSTANSSWTCWKTMKTMRRPARGRGSGAARRS